LFGIVSIALGGFGLLFFAVVPTLIVKPDAQTIFIVLASAMTLAVIPALVGFPRIERGNAAVWQAASHPGAP
jgi:hypothetical protein